MTTRNGSPSVCASMVVIVGQSSGGVQAVMVEGKVFFITSGWGEIRISNIDTSVANESLMLRKTLPIRDAG
ncbi:MAG: hypothetical protein IH820_14525 [Bacteroidetes bacterium]|nr:hypothetical protein [Bacteroidota bacterium]